MLWEGCAGKTINGERYRQQLIKLKRVIAKKLPEFATRHEPKIFQYGNARAHVAIPVKNYLEQLLPSLAL